MRLQGKTILVTAAGQGIGRACALAMAREGATVWATDLKQDLLNAYAGEPNIKTHILDVLKTVEVDAFAKKIGKIDVLFNCAGFVHQGDIMQVSDADWDFSMDLNVKSMYLMTRAVLPMMLEAGKGAIVCTSSISAVYATPNEVLYDATKGACHMFARAIAVEFRDRGIRCNAICPGFIETPHGLREVKELTALGVDVSEAALKAAQGRFGQPEDIARAALYLASDDAEFVNGTQLFVDNAFSAV